MAIAIVQTVTTDPAPSNIGNLGGAGDVSGGHVCIASSLGFQAGNYLVGLGETANFAGTTAVKFTDAANGDWTTLEHLNCRSAPNGVTDGLDVILAYMPVTAAIAPGFVGKVSASGAGTATVTKFDGTSPGWTVGQWVGVTCQEYSTGAGGTISANAANTLTFSGGQTPSIGSPIVVGGFVKFTNTSSGEDYTAATIVEVSGASGIFGHSSNQNTFISGATVSTGTIAAWSGTGLAISFCADDNDDGTSPYNPLSATGTDDGVLWKFNLATAIARQQHQVVTSPGAAYGMNFTTQTGDHHMAFLVVLQQTGAATAIEVLSHRNQMFVDESLILT
jgi:hypothetical protein